MKYLSALLMTFLLSFTLWATPVANLYQVQVAVASQSDADKMTATKLGLQQMLVKIGGNTNILANQKIQSALAQANNYVEAFSYQTNPAPTDNNNLLLTLSFSRSAINQLLQTTGQSIWPGDRPLVLAFIAVNDGVTQQVVKADDASAVNDYLTKLAVQRGVPLIFPILDLQDINNQINFNNVWTTNAQVLQTAANRYNSNALLMVQLIKNGDSTWNSQWVLNIDGDQASFSANNVDQNTAMTQGFNQVIDALAAHYSLLTTTNTSQQETITIADVKDLASAARAQQYLQRLSPVRQAILTRMQDNQLQFVLVLSGTEKDFLRAINLDQNLTPIPANQVDNYLPAKLYYRWV